MSQGAQLKLSKARGAEAWASRDARGGTDANCSSAVSSCGRWRRQRRSQRRTAAEAAASLEEPLAGPTPRWCVRTRWKPSGRMKEDGSRLISTICSLSLCRSLLRARLVDRFRVVMFPVITGATGAERIYDGYPDVALEMIYNRTFAGDPAGRVPTPRARAPTARNHDRLSDRSHHVRTPDGPEVLDRNLVRGSTSRGCSGTSRRELLRFAPA